MFKLDFKKLASALVLYMFTVHGVHASTLWIGNDTTSPVERYTSSGTFIDQWGITGATGTALDGIGFVYTVVPSGNDSVITKYDASGTAVATIHFTTGTENGNGFPSWIEDMAYRSNTNTLWVSGFNGIIYNIDLSGNKLSEFDTGHTFTGIATDGTYLYTTGGFDDDTVVKRNFDGTIISTFSTGFSGGGGIGYDASDSTLWVGYSGLVRHFDLSGTLLALFSTPTSGAFHDGLEVGEVGSLVTLAFPLPGQDPESATINSIFDHSMLNEKGKFKIYGCDATVVAYTNEKGNIHGSGLHLKSSPEYFKIGCRQGYAKDQNHSPFLVNGYYSGGGDPTHLYYDGHPGIDYQANFEPVVATSSGKVYYPQRIVGLGTTAFSPYHVIEIVPNDFPEYRIYYLHMKSHPAGSSETRDDSTPGCPSPVHLPLPPGSNVKAGCLIGVSGDAGPKGTPPHLHFEVHRVLDSSAVPDDVRAQTRCVPDTSIPEDASLIGKVCVPVDPYGWRSSDPDPYEHVTGLPSLPLW